MPDPIPPESTPEGLRAAPTPPPAPRAVLSVFYVMQFGHMGVVLPFLAPWIQSRGYGPVGIGLLLALPPLFKVLAPWGWGRWADRSGRRRELLAAASLVAALALAALPWVERTVALGLLMALYGFARAPILPYVEATVLEQSQRQRFAYGSIRLWGSLSFVGVSTGYGLLRVHLPSDAGLLIASGMLLAGAAIAGMAFPPPVFRRYDREGARGPGEPKPTTRGSTRLFATCALMQISHGAYYTFYSIRLQDLGFGGAAIGSLWALGVLCEVALMTRMDRVVDRHGTARVLRVCLILAAVRWALLGSVASTPWLIAAQTLHAATYAGFHVAAIREVHRIFGETQPAKGQALYSGMTYGLGMFVGSSAAGACANVLGIPGLFWASAGIALIAVAILRPAPVGSAA